MQRSALFLLYRGTWTQVQEQQTPASGALNYFPGNRLDGGRERMHHAVDAGGAGAAEAQPRVSRVQTICLQSLDLVATCAK